MTHQDATRKSVIWLLVASVSLSIIMRWPTSSHETGIDSFFIHNLANSIYTFNEIKWDANLLSYFGYYPLSYPSGVPIILAELSLMTGIDIECLVLLLSFFSGIIATIASFVLALELKKSPLFGFAIAVTYSSAPLLLLMNQWTATTRGVFLALLPLILWTLIRLKVAKEKEQDRYAQILLIIILAFLILLVAFIHRLVILLIILFASYIIARILTARKLQTRFGHRKEKIMRVSIAITLFILILIPDIYFSFMSGWLGLESYETGFFSGDSILSKFLNLMASIAASIGFPLAFLFPIAAFLIYKKRENWTFIGILLFLPFVLLLPLSGSRIYERMMYPLVILPIIFFSAYVPLTKRWKKAYQLVLVIFIITTLPLNIALVDHWEDWPKTKIVDDGNSMSDQTYMTALYVRHLYPQTNFIGNNWIASLRIQSISMCPEIPNGLSPTSSLNVILYDIIDIDELDVEPATFDEIIESQGVFFKSKWELKPETDWLYIFLSKTDPEKTAALLTLYKTEMLIEDVRLGGKISGWYSEIYYPLTGEIAPFIATTYKSSYKVYDNGRECIWLI